MSARIPDHVALKESEIERILRLDAARFWSKLADRYCFACGIEVPMPGYCWDCNRNAFKTTQEKKP